MRRKAGLTAKRIAAIKRPGRYFDGHGLYLQVHPGKGGLRRSWILRYALNGHERWLGLGPLHTVGPAEARERARKARLQLLDGIDPVAARKQKKADAALQAAKAINFQAAARTYHAQHEGEWRSAKHAREWLATLETYAFPAIGALPVAEINTGLVLKCIEPIWQTKWMTANRVRGRIESVLDWARVREYRDGENPPRWKGHLAEVLPARPALQKQHHAALPWREIGAFVAQLRAREGIAARALEFAILTAARAGEVLNAQWNEIDFGGKTWTVPAGRMKGGKQHRVPLSDRAMEILRTLPREDGNTHPFVGPQRGRGLSSMALRGVLKRLRRRDLTVHGFRSTFRDWASEATNFPHAVAEMALAHTVAGVEGAYRRGDLFEKRKRLMADWARFCMTPTAVNGGKVVAIRQ